MVWGFGLRASRGVKASVLGLAIEMKGCDV